LLLSFEERLYPGEFAGDDDSVVSIKSIMKSVE